MGGDLLNEHQPNYMENLPQTPEPMEEINRKRLRSASSSSTGSAEEIQVTKKVVTSLSWPRFLFIKSIEADKPLSMCHAVAIEKSIYGVLGSENFKVTRMRNGNLIVEVEKERHSRSLLNLKSIACHDSTIPVTVQPHQSLNSSKGVARCPEFKLFKQDEIASVLESQGVTHARRIEITRNGNKIPTGTVILTFDQPQLPKKIKLGFQIVNVDLCIPSPMRCFRCQRFGHTADRCKRNITGTVCAEEGHDD